MSTIKSYSVGDGDMFYINHSSDSFTLIDCHLDDDRRARILKEISSIREKKGITRFISTHPDEDHIAGLVELDDRIGITNFYCVENRTTKEDESLDFKRYKRLRNSSKAFYLHAGCSRRWLNRRSRERGTSGLRILWPDTSNQHFKAALKRAANGDSPNDISPIIQYRLRNGVTALWMGDLETDYMEAIEEDVQLPQVDLLFAPHHGRDSGRVPDDMLTDLDPQIIVIGEAPSEHLNYYRDYNTITQNSAGDIIFRCLGGKVRIFTSKRYKVDYLDDECCSPPSGFSYLGTLWT